MWQRGSRRGRPPLASFHEELRAVGEQSGRVRARQGYLRARRLSVGSRRVTARALRVASGQDQARVRLVQLHGVAQRAGQGEDAF